MAQGDQRCKAFGLLCQLETALARSAARPSTHARPYALLAECTLRMRDSDRVLVYNEVQRLQLLMERCLHDNGVKDAVQPAAALELQLAVSASTWIHDRLRDGLLWRALLWEHGLVAAAFCRFGMHAKRYVRRYSVEWVDEGPMLTKPTRSWMEEVFSEHVGASTSAIVAASPQPTKAVKVKVRAPHAGHVSL